MKKYINIDDRFIGREYPPFIVAEMSGNHNQSLEQALDIVAAAAGAGVSAVKLQTYTADTLTIDARGEAFCIRDSHSPWKGQNLYSLYKKAYTPWEWHAPIFKKCRELGLIVFSSPFDETAVDFLETLNVPAYKIASFENNHLPLIRKAASTGKPLIISTGMATIAELDEAVKTARDAGCKDIILLKCTSAYPATPQDSHLAVIPHLRQHFDVEVGLSDHTLGIGVSIASVALGASLIEKHFTLNRSEGSVDAVFSLEPHEMKLLVQEANQAWKAIGEVYYGPTESERASFKFRRSVYAVEDIEKGMNFTRENIRIIRPGDGLPPKYFDQLLDRKASCYIKKGTPLNWSNTE